MSTTAITPVRTDPANPASPTRLVRILRGPANDPAWVRPTLVALLALTAVLYLWNLSASGWANSFYSAAAQAGSVNWEAFFFGSSDAANSITVDKTPAALWVMALSVRLFGLNSWSLLVPQALMGVGTTGLVYLTVRRSMRNRFVGETPAATWTAPTAGLVAALAMALTPVAVLMFTFNNPDALLVLLLTASAYALVRACERGSAKWMALVGTLIGVGFLTKMLQAFLILPVFAVVYLVTAPNPIKKRAVGLGVGFGAMLLSAGWWIAIVELVPADMRPYIGGSQNNSIMELVLGYNGLGRLTGNETGSVGGGGPGRQWGETGIGRMFNAEIGGQVAWLIPAAVILGLVALWFLRAAPRTDATRGALLMWGGWLAVTGLVFSFMGGIFHAYYTVALAPAVGAVVGIGFVIAWEQRETYLGRGALAATTLVTAIWSFVLLHRSSEFLPWLAPAVLLVGVATTGLLLVGPGLPRRLVIAAVLAIGFVALAGPTAYAVQTSAVGHTGSIPSAGPTISGSGPGGRMGGPGVKGGPGTGQQGGPGAVGNRAFGQPGDQGGPAALGLPGAGGPSQFGGIPQAGQMPPGLTGTFGQQQAPGAQSDGASPRGGPSGLLESRTPSAEVTDLLERNADQYTWAAAAIGSQNASGYQLATGDPVMAIGGFNGSDPSPTLAQFKQYVRDGQIHYFIAESQDGPAGGTGGAGGGSGRSQGESSEISAWVTENFEPITIDGVTLYDLGASSTVA